MIQAILSLKLKSICLNYSLLIYFLLILQTGFAQFSFEGIDRLMESKKKAAGGKIVTLIQKDGKVIYKKEIGEEFTSETPEPVGTASKWLSAALVMTFVDKGELSLDDPVSKYIPSLVAYSKNYITIRQCLAEITGIESEQKKVVRIMQKKKFSTLEEQVNYFAAHKDIVTQPGKELFFGEVGYSLAGRVLEVISKRKPFSKLMLERILKPLGMKKTTFVSERGAESPSDGAVSTAGDYIKFMSMILNNGEFNGKQILSKEAILEMEKVQFGDVPVRSLPKLVEGFRYGYGVWIQENNSTKVIACPDLYGTWPYIDRCRKYACIIFTKQQNTEQNQGLFLAVKNEIEEQIKADCRSL